MSCELPDGWDKATLAEGQDRAAVLAEALRLLRRVQLGTWRYDSTPEKVVYLRRTVRDEVDAFLSRVGDFCPGGRRGNDVEICLRANPEQSNP